MTATQRRANWVSDETIDAILHDREAGAKLQNLAIIHGLHISTVSRICNGIEWRHRAPAKQTMDSTKVQRVFTTGQIAKMFEICPRTVSKWADSGELKSYRLPRPSGMGGDRRINRSDLIAFLTSHGMPLFGLETETMQSALLVAVDLQAVAKIKATLPPDGYRYTSAETLFEAGTRIPEFKPTTIVIDFRLGRNDCLLMVQHLRRQEAHKDTLIIALAGEDETNPDYLIAIGFSDVFKQPVDVRNVAKRIAEAKQPA